VLLCPRVFRQVVDFSFIEEGIPLTTDNRPLPGLKAFSITIAKYVKDSTTSPHGSYLDMIEKSAAVDGSERNLWHCNESGEKCFGHSSRTKK